MRGIDQVLEREITAEQYERAIHNHGYLLESDKNNVFSASELYGYGVYGGSVFQKEGQHYVRFSLGSTCD